MRLRLSSNIFVYLAFICIAFFYLSPLLHTAILITVSNDLANHVRHIYEYKLALLEHQFPPRVAPLLNGAIRIPLFQFYSATSYTLPGILSLIGLNAYSALKVSLFILSLLSAITLFHALLVLTHQRSAAWIGALSFQLYTFSIVDLYIRGAFVEWTSLQLAIIAFSCLVFFIQAYKNNKPLIYKALLCILSTSYFICCHPVQTLYLGALIATILLTWILTSSISHKLKLIFYLIAIAGISAALTLWFWGPILANISFLNIAHDTGFFSADTTFVYVFYPWFHLTPFFHWAPQVGLIATIACVFILATFKHHNFLLQLCSILWLALLASVISASNLHTNSLLLSLFSPLQWSYRLLITSAILSVILISFACKLAFTCVTSKTQHFLTCLLTFYIIVNAIPYFKNISDQAVYTQSLKNIITPSFMAPNSTASYTLKGLDVRRFALKDNKNIVLPTHTEAVDIFIALPEKTVFSVFINQKKIHTQRFSIDKKTGLYFSIPPSAGKAQILFLNNPTLYPLESTSFYYHFQSDNVWFRLLPISTLKTLNIVESGFYQLPICYYKGAKLRVDGNKIEHKSLNKLFFISYLPQGLHTLSYD